MLPCPALWGQLLLPWEMWDPSSHGGIRAFNSAACHELGDAEAACVPSSRSWAGRRFPCRCPCSELPTESPLCPRGGFPITRNVCPPPPRTEVERSQGW